MIDPRIQQGVCPGKRVRSLAPVAGSVAIVGQPSRIRGARARVLLRCGETMRAGEVIDGRFEVEKFVTRGGMGDIYRARDRSTGRPIALKLIPPWPEEARLSGRLANEARALVELAHPAVVRYVAHGTTDEHGAYLAMEWLDGVTLWERLQATPLGLDETLTLAERVAEGLGLAHARGMVHRDVKPLNLLLVGGRVDQVKILDFGIVRMGPRQGITATGVGIGTPEYMAPEQARGERGIGPAADVFSLGCVLYKCLTGQAAFRGDHVAAVLAKVAMLEAPPRVAEVRHDMPSIVDDLVARMMAVRPAERPADGAACALLVREVQRQLTASGGAAAVRAPSSLTRRERRPLSVLYAELGSHERPALNPQVEYAPTDPALKLAQPMPPVFVGEEPVARGPSDTWRLLPAVRRALEPFQARVEPLLDGSLVAMLAGGAALTDLAVRSARSALALRGLLPEASLGVATLQAEVDDGSALADVIDGAVTRVRAGSRTIRVDRRTQTLLPERFELRGDDEGGFVLVAERERGADPRDAARRLLGTTTPFVGRKRTLRQLVALYDGCVEDHAAQAVVILGDAGVGKSRLRNELLATLEQQEAPPTVLFARGDPLRAGLPFGALERALLSLLAAGEPPGERRRVAIAAAVARRLPAAEAQRVAEFLGEICGVVFPSEDSPPLRAARQDPALMADQRRRAFEDWLLAECGAEPMVLVIEDLHWVDHATIELVASALRRARDLPLLVVALARHEAKDRFPTLDAAWERQELRLEPLRPADCGELVRAALGEAIDGELMRRLVDRSAGNPFFLEELIRSAAAGESRMLPDTVLGSVQLRLARLSEPARQALRAGSIFGAFFRAAGVARLLRGDTTEGGVEAILEMLVDAELLHRRAAGDHAFRHDLLRQAAYAMLTETDRRLGHRLAGEYLLEAGETDPVVLAEHFAGSGAVEQATEWFQRAAEAALGAADDEADSLRKAATHFRRAAEVCAATYANENAIAFYDRAITLWAPLDPREAGRARLACARIRERSGQRDRAFEEMRLAEEEADRAGDVPTKVEALLGRSDIEKRSAGVGALDRAWQLGERARDLAQSIGAHELEANALCAMASVLTNQESEDASQKAVHLARLALSLTSEHGDLASRLWWLGNAFLLRNDAERAALLYRDALAIAERTGDDLLAARCHSNTGMAHFRRWHLDRAIEATQRALEIYQRMGHRVRIAERKLNLGAFWVKRGHLAPAEVLLNEVLAGSTGDWILTTAALDSLAQLERQRGNEPAAQRHLAAAARACEEVGVPQRLALYLGMLSESLSVSGDPGGAIHHLERAAAVSNGATLGHGLLLAQLGSLEQAAALLERFRDADPDPDRKAVARVALARVLLLQGELDEARARCADALEVLSPTPLPQHVLPAEALMACIDRQPAFAVMTLRAASVHCTRAICDEIATDVGSLLCACPESVTVEQVRSYLEATASPVHRGISYRIHYIRAQLLGRFGVASDARPDLEKAQEQLRCLATSLPEPYREELLGSPWVTEMMTVFSVSR
jgi:eukaryotic-like serine/threonine-protein kinase